MLLRWPLKLAQTGGVIPDLNNGTLDTTSSSITGLGAASEQSEGPVLGNCRDLFSLLSHLHCRGRFRPQKNKDCRCDSKETSKAVAHMPLIIGFPLTTLIGVLGMFLVWAWTFGNIYTMGEVVLDDFQSNEGRHTCKCHCSSLQLSDKSASRLYPCLLSICHVLDECIHSGCCYNDYLWSLYSGTGARLTLTRAGKYTRIAPSYLQACIGQCVIVSGRLPLAR